MSRNFILNTEFQNLLFLATSRNFLEPWISPGSGHFCQFWCVRYQFNFLSLNMNFASKIEKCHVLDVFRCQLSTDPKIARNLKNYKLFSFFWGKIHIQWQKLSWIDTKHIKIGKKWPLSGNSRVPENFW